MSISSIKSLFQLDSYKIDKIDFSVNPTLDVLAQKAVVVLNENDFNVSFRNPFRFKDGKNNIYVTGVKISIKLRNKQDLEIAQGTFIITGLFYAKGFENITVEENVAKFQGPTILLPYIRACITNTLANAGFGSIVLPLINMNIVANNMELQIEDKGTAFDKK